MKLSRRILLVGICICLLAAAAGCSKPKVTVKDSDKGNANKENENEKTENEESENKVKHDNRYLSFTVTGYEDYKIYNYTYDLETGQVENRGEIDQTAQYSLCVYDEKKNTLYYSNRIQEGELKGCDQLFSKNLDSGEVTQLTTDIFAINAIVPMDNGVFMLACGRKEHNVKPYYYDYKSGELIYPNTDPDLIFWKMGYSAADGTVFVTAYSEKEDMEVFDKYEDYGAPTTYIYKIQPEKSIEPVLIKEETSKNIFAITAESEDICYYTTSNLSFNAWQDTPRNVLKYTVGNNEAEEAFVISTNYNVHGGIRFVDSDHIIFYGEEKKPSGTVIDSGVYLYNIKTEEAKKIFCDDYGFINNYIMLSGKD